MSNLQERSPVFNLQAKGTFKQCSEDENKIISEKVVSNKYLYIID